MKRASIFILCMVVFHSFGQTLNDAEYYSKYKNAVQKYANGEYAESQDILADLTHRKYNNAMVPYAHYYHALCSFKMNRFFESRIMLRQLFDRYADWKNIDEAYFLYASAAFEDNFYTEAIEYADRVEEAAMKKDVLKMEKHYFSKISDLSLLKGLNKKYPNNRPLAEVIVAKIQATKSPKREELELSDLLTNKFNIGVFTPSKNNTTRPNNSDKNKGSINFAIALPFNIAEYNSNYTSPANQYVYDIVEGMKLAQEKLDAEGIKLNIAYYDVDKKADNMLDIANSDKGANIDVLVGPLYAEPNKVASGFVAENNIIQIHPLSNNSQLINGQQNVFLAQPSYESQALKAFEFMTEEFPSKNIAIYYGSSKKDSTFAYIYRDVAFKKGANILQIKKYEGDASISIKSKPGHVFLVGSDESVGEKMIRSLEKNKVNAPVITTSSIVDFEKVSLSTLNKEIFFIYPEFINNSKDEVKNFRSAYVAQQNMIPSYFSYWGYDIALFFGRMLGQGKNIFRSNLELINYTQGYNLGGFDYTESKNDNQIIPIVKFQDGKFVELSR